MANDLTNVMPKILARGLMALRERVIMPQLVNSDYSNDAAQKGDVINVPVPTAKTATDVTASNTPPSPADYTPDTVAITMDNWKHSDFHLTDKDMVEIDKNRHFVPMAMDESVRAIANAINTSLMDQYVSVYGFTGTPGTTPFASDVSDITAARKILNQQLCPLDMRRGVVDFEAEAEMLSLAAFRDASQSSDSDVIINGQIGRKFGFDWYADDHVPLHTAGTASGATTDDSGYAVGVKTVTLDSAGTGTIVVGDIITFAGDDQTYTVTSGDADVSNGGTISFEPGLKVAIETSTHAITVKGNHRVNLAFHRDAFAFAMRPLMSSDVDAQLGNRILSMQDPVSGLVMRLEVSRQYKQTVWDLDCLWGVKCVRPELATRIAG